MDEVAEASEGYEFEYMLSKQVLANKLTSSQFIDWVNNQPIKHDRQRFRMIRNANGISKAHISFVAADKRYYPAVMLASTIPGIPKLTDYELFGNAEADAKYGITPTNAPAERSNYWSKILNIRNSSNALKYGDIKNVWKSGDNTYAYSRTYQKEATIVVVNFSNKQAIITLNLPLKSGIILFDELNNEEFTVNDPADFKVSVFSYGARILTIKN